MTTNTQSQSVNSKNQRRYPLPDLKKLFGWSAGRCAFPDCREICLERGVGKDEPIVTGIIAHIDAHSDNGPRANTALTLNERDSYDNWVLLCPKHHIIVDGQKNYYTREMLRQWKIDLEQWVESKLREVLPHITHAEIRQVCFSILQSPVIPSDSFDATPILENMLKNGLTPRSRNLLRIGTSLFPDIASFIQFMSVPDPQFAERLKAAFVNEYDKFFQEGYRGDALFEALLIFVNGASPDFDIQCAALAVLAYMFVMCEVFEK